MERNQIPPDLVYDPDNPIMVNSCSNNDAAHTPDCDGICEPKAMDEYDILLNNEFRAWARLGQAVIAVPYGMGAPGMQTNLLEIEIRITAMVELLLDKGIVEQSDLDFLYKKSFYERLHDTRMANEDSIKRARAQQALSVAQRKLLGPNGFPLN